MYIMRIFILSGREREGEREGGTDGWMDGTEREREARKIAIRGDGKSPDQKVIDMQLQASQPSIYI